MLRSRPTWKRGLLALAVVLALFVGWRLVTFPGFATPADDSPVRLAGLVAERLPELEVEADLGVSRASAAISETATDAGSRSIDGWLADRELALEARCVDVDGNPLAGVEVIASQAGFDASALSDADGRVRIERNVAWIDWSLTLESFVRGRARRSVELFDVGEMQVRVLARRSGYATVETRPQVILGETVQAGELVLLPAGSVTGRVVDADGAPVEGANVRIVNSKPTRTRKHGETARFDSQRNKAPTDRTGRFEVDAAVAGTIALEARDAAGRVGERRDVLVSAGEVTEVVIVLAQSSERLSISGRVLSAAGEPVARAIVVVRDTDVEQTRWRASADALGAFRFEVRVDVPVSIEAWDPRGIHGLGHVAEVAPGTKDIAVRLDAGRSIAVEVVREDGTPVEPFGASVFMPRVAGEPDDEMDTSSLFSNRAPAGAFFSSLNPALEASALPRIAIPRRPFVVQVTANGLRPRTVGPFEPEQAPEVLHVELEAMPTLRGRVVRDGQPVAGAKITPCTLITGGGTRLIDGFPTRFLAAVQSVRSDREGHFTITSDAPHATVLRAEVRGAAPTEVGPLALESWSSSAELEIALSRGGDLEGEVLVDEGRERAGIVVGITRGDGFPRTQRTDRAGRFRFEYLTPGPWYVHEHYGEIQPSSWSWNMEEFGPDHVWPTSAHVVEGRTSFFQIDLRERPALRFRGSAFADGRALAGWNVTLLSESLSERTLQRERVETTVGADGCFELDVHEPGVHRLTLDEPSASRPRAIHDTVTIEAPVTSWSCELTTGTLAGTASPSSRRMHHVARTTNGARVRSRITPDRDGRFRLEGVLAGRGAIVVEPARSADVDPSLWPVLREVDVTPGAVTSIDLP